MSANGPGPDVLAAGARRALHPSAGWGRAWPRAAILLARQSREDAVRGIWYGSTYPLRFCSMATQLVCLPFYLDDRDLARRVRDCWYPLSNACHAHPYELSPTIVELEGWLEVVDQLVAEWRRDQFRVHWLDPRPDGTRVSGRRVREHFIARGHAPG
jgi:hypothetical protein